MAKETQGDLLLLGRGKLYFDRLDDSGNPTGERFLGNCTRLESTTTDDLREKYSSAVSSSDLMKSVNVRRTQELAITLDEYDPENLALALMGEKATFTQTGGTITGESVTAVGTDRYFKLANRQVSAVAVTDDPMTLTYVEGTDYDVDAASGRIYIIDGGAITAGTALLVDYTAAAITAMDKVIGGNKNTIEGSMRFIGDPASGPVYECEIWSVSINPDGAASLIGDDFGEIPLKGKIQADSVNHPTEPLWRLLRLS